MKGYRAVALLISAILVVSLVAGCGATPTPTPPPAPTKAPAAAPTTAPAAPAPSADKPTGKLNVLTSPQPDWCKAQTETFAKLFKVETQFVRMSGGEAFAKVTAEKANQTYDVWWGSPIDRFIAAKADGLLEKFVPENAAKLPAKYKDPDGYWYGIYVGSIGWAINSKRLAEKKLPMPKTWDDLANPAYKGEIVMAHPATSGTALTTIATILQMKGDAAGWEYLKKFHANVLQYTKSGAGPMRMIDNAEATIGVVFSHDIVAEIKSGYKDVQLVFPADGTGYEVGGMALIKGAKNPYEAKQWINWALSKEGQEVGPTVKAYQAPTNPEATPSMPELMQVKLIEYDFAWVGANEKAIVKKYTDDIAPTVPTQ